MSRLSVGKIPIRVLNRTVLKMTGVPWEMIVVGPEPGVDFGVVRAEGGYLIVSSDPITGVASGIGRYAVNVSANDVATSGNRPQFMESVIMLPDDATEGDLAALAEEMDNCARSAGISLVGGHTELTPGLRRPIVVATVFCFAKDYVSAAGAKEGDAILMTKTAGLEGTAVLIRESERLGFSLDAALKASAGPLEAQLSVVPEAIGAYSTGVVHGMHDCTEGGVLGAVYEMSLASGIGFELREAAVPVAPATARLSRALSLDPLRLIGSGSLLIAVDEAKQGKVKSALKRVCTVSEVGTFRKGSRVLVRKRGGEKLVRSAPTDELWRTIARLG